MVIDPSPSLVVFSLICLVDVEYTQDTAPEH